MADNYLERRYEEVSSGRARAALPQKPSLDKLLVRNVECRHFDSDYAVHMLQLEAIISVNDHISNIPSGCQMIVSPFIGCLQDAIGEIFKSNDAPKAFLILGFGDKADPEAGVVLGMKAQTMLLKAVELGLAGSLILDFNKEEVMRKTGISFEPVALLAVGKPAGK